tara:strand:+ start:447 stop:647 length:201 start_codon:yes stop_codon:yes gene_type:complete
MDKKTKKKLLLIVGGIVIILIIGLSVWHFKKVLAALKFLMKPQILIFIILIFAGIYALLKLNKTNK